jgi:hypothetical protein
VLVAVIAGGLALDQHLPWGQPVVDVVVWALFLRWLWSADRAGRVVLVACVAFATLGECLLSLAWGLYDYRLGSVPWFVPPGHALLLMLGMLVAARLPDRVTWLVPLAAAPLVAWQAVTGVDRLGLSLFALLLVAMWRGRAPQALRGDVRAGAGDGALRHLARQLAVAADGALARLVDHQPAADGGSVLLRAGRAGHGDPACSQVAGGDRGATRLSGSGQRLVSRSCSSRADKRTMPRLSSMRHAASLLPSTSGVL